MGVVEVLNDKLLFRVHVKQNLFHRCIAVQVGEKNETIDVKYGAMYSAYQVTRTPASSAEMVLVLTSLVAKAASHGNRPFKAFMVAQTCNSDGDIVKLSRG